MGDTARPEPAAAHGRAWRPQRPALRSDTVCRSHGVKATLARVQSVFRRPGRAHRAVAIIELGFGNLPRLRWSYGALRGGGVSVAPELPQPPSAQSGLIALADRALRTAPSGRGSPDSRRYRNRGR